MDQGTPGLTQNELQPTVTQVKVSKRLDNAPAVIVSPFPSSMKSYFQLMEPGQLEAFKTNHTMEINPNHKIIVGLNSLRKVDLATANLVLMQLLDNTLLSCGLLLDPTDSVNRVNKLIENTISSSLHLHSAEDSKQPHREEKTKSTASPSEKEAILREALARMKDSSKQNAAGTAQDDSRTSN